MLPNFVGLEKMPVSDFTLLGLCKGRAAVASVSGKFSRCSHLCHGGAELCRFLRSVKLGEASLDQRKFWHTTGALL